MNHNPCIMFADEETKLDQLLHTIDFGYVKVVCNHQDPDLHINTIKPIHVNIVDEMHWLSSMIQQTPVYVLIFDTTCFGNQAKQSLVKMLLSQKGTLHVISTKTPVLVEYSRYKNTKIMNDKPKACATDFVNLVIDPQNLKHILKTPYVHGMMPYCDVYSNKVVQDDEKFWVVKNPCQSK